MQPSTKKSANDPSSTERPSSIPTSPINSTANTEPYSSSSRLPLSLPDSPIAPSHIYKAPVATAVDHQESTKAGVLCLRGFGGNDGSGDSDGYILCEYPLHKGANSIKCGAMEADKQLPPQQQMQEHRAVDLPLTDSVDALIEIGDGLHVLYDHGSGAGVFLGHRRSRVRHGVGYVLTDGKLIWLGKTSFWYRILDSRGSEAGSPPPPWRIADRLSTKLTAASLDRLSATVGAQASGKQPATGGATMPDKANGGIQVSRPKPNSLRRENMIQGVQPSPVPPPNSLAHLSPEVLSLLGSQGGMFELPPNIIKSPNYESDDSLPHDTEPMSSHSSIAGAESVGSRLPPILPPHEEEDNAPQRYADASLSSGNQHNSLAIASPPRPLLPLSSPPTNDAGMLNVLQAEEPLRIQPVQPAGQALSDGRESPSASTNIPTSPANDSDNGGVLEGASSPIPELKAPPKSPSAVSDAGNLHQICDTPPEESDRPIPSSPASENVATQPASPSHFPPGKAPMSRNTSTSLGTASKRPNPTMQPSTTQPAGTVQTANRPQQHQHQQQTGAADEPFTYLPEPTAFAYAPSRVIFMDDSAAAANENMGMPRYLYDVERMESFLRSASQATASTQGDFSQEFAQGTAETALSSNFSQKFLSPPAGQASPTKAMYANGPSSGNGLLISGIHAEQPKEAQSSATKIKRRTHSKGNKYSIDNYTDESDDESNDESDDGDAVAASTKTSTATKEEHTKTSNRSGLKSSSPTVSSYSQRFSGPTMHPVSSGAPSASRLRHSRQPPLALLSSAQSSALGVHLPPPPPFRVDQSRTPLPRSQFAGTILTRANQPAVSTSILHRHPRSATDSDHSPLPFSRMLNTQHADFPDDLPTLFGTQGLRKLTQDRASTHTRSGSSSASYKRESSMGSKTLKAVTGSPLTAQDPLPFSPTSTPTKTRTKAASAGGILVSHSSDALDGHTATKKETKQQLPIEKSLSSNSPGNSSPLLPQPSMLLQSRPADTSKKGVGSNKSTAGKTAGTTSGSRSKATEPAANHDKEASAQSGDALTDQSSFADALFSPMADPLTSPSSSGSSNTGTAKAKEESKPTIETQATQLDDDVDADSSGKQPPRIHLRVNGKRAADAEPKADSKPFVDGSWISMDKHREEASRITPTKAAKSTGVKRSGMARRKLAASNNSSNSSSSNSLSGDGNSDSSPAMTRSRSLRDSLRKLPGNRGLSRTGLSSRRTPARKTRQLQPDKESPLAKTQSTPAQKQSSAPPSGSKGKRSMEIVRTSYGGLNSGEPSTSDHENEESSAIDASKRQRLYGARSSHRSLNFSEGADSEQQKPAQPQHSCAIKHVTVTGFQDEEKDRLCRQLELNGLSVTENPLLADVCIRQGKLGRTLKVLCAISRGIPIVTQSWVTELSSVIKAKADEAALLDLAYSHLLADPATERDWGVVLSETLERARKNGGQLLPMFCVYIADDVARPDPVYLSVMVRSAGGHVLNDFGKLEENLLEGESNTQWVLHTSRRSSAVAAAELPANEQPVPIDMAADKALIGDLSESSSEPDDDADEDWSAENDRAKRRTSGGNAGNGGRKPKRTPKSTKGKRRVKPKLERGEDLKAESASASATAGSAADSHQQEMAFEKSMILAPPHPHLPVHRRSNSTTSPSESSPTPRHRQSQRQPATKRRRVDESPSMATTAMKDFSDANQDAAVCLDPACKREEMQDAISARKSELGIPADTQFLVISANTKTASIKKWQTHGAIVVEPELVVQSIIHSALQF